MHSGPVISLIVPFYNSENYIENCARSLFEQTLDEIEFIFVNDCSTDKSLEILSSVCNEYKSRNIQIINHKVNQGVSTSRNTGLKNATGKYVGFCDSDDLPKPDMYKIMVESAEKDNYDIVSCNHIEEYVGDKKYNTLHVYQYEKDKYECIRRILTADGVSPYLWDKIAKRELYIKNNLSFPTDLHVREDFLMCIKLYYYSKSHLHIEDFLYRYQVIPDSLSRGSNYRYSHRIKALDHIAYFLSKKSLLMRYEKDILLNKAQLKTKILVREDDFRNWLNLFPEINPVLNDLQLSRNQKTLLVWAANGSHHLISLYRKMFQLKETLTRN